MNPKGHIFRGVYFAVLEDTAIRLSDTHSKMVKLLKNGGAEEVDLYSAELTHVICNTVDYSSIQRVVANAAFFKAVIPKWVFISRSMFYQLPSV